MKERGASILEFSLLSSVFFMLVFGMMDFSYVFVQHSRISNAAREIGRAAAVREEDCRQFAIDELEQRLLSLGFDDSSPVAAAYEDDQALNVRFLRVAVNVEMRALTTALSGDGSRPLLTYTRAFTFPVEHPDFCQ